jgi:hypothetical protein
VRQENDCGLTTDNTNGNQTENMIVMKKLYILGLSVMVLGLIAVPAAFAKGKKNKGGAPATQTVTSDVYVKYDVNSNATLDPDEKKALLADFAKDANDPLLKPLDLNNDGKLSDDEIAAIPATKTVDAPPAEKKSKKNK